MSTSPELLNVTASDGVSLSIGAFEAEHASDRAEHPRVLLIHGIASHQGWYYGLARRLCHEGISVYAMDRRGSGLSGGTRGHMNRWQDIVDDITKVHDMILSRPGNGPVHLVGISLGGMYSIATALLHPERFGTVVLSAPALATKIKVSLWRRLKVLRRNFTQPTKLYDLPFGPADLTDRDDWQDAIAKDLLRTSKVSARFLIQLFKMQGFVNRGISRLKTPTLALLAGQDAVIDSAKAADALSKVSGRPTWVETFEESQHIIPASLPRKALMERLVPWFKGEWPCEVNELKKLTTSLETLEPGERPKAPVESWQHLLPLDPPNWVGVKEPTL